MPLPPARWRHTATLTSQTSLMIFGGYLSHDERLNDMWMFDTVSLEWSQLQANNPRQPASVYHLSHQDASHKDVPAPRGGHSATLVGTDAVWLFGGYGGFGYSRKEMDDLYRLDIRSNSWELIQPKGGGPEARSGHQCQAVQLKLLLHGGGCGLGGVEFWGWDGRGVWSACTIDPQCITERSSPPPPYRACSRGGGRR